MRASDVVARLAVLLPQLTGSLTSNIPVRSLSRSGAKVTALCDEPHELRPGDPVNIAGSVVPIPIGALSRSGETGTLVTTTSHDLTEPIASMVEVSGAVEANFNGVFDVVSIPNRKKIIFSMGDSGATMATGSPVLLGGESALRDYNTLYAVLGVPGPAEFTFLHPETSLPDPVGEIVARVKPRIAAVVDVDRAADSYTRQGTGDLWLFVSLEDAVASKDRGTPSDAVAYHGRGSEYRQQVIQSFSAYLFVPVSESVSGGEGRDAAEEFFRPLCRSLLFSKFDSNLADGGQGTVQFVSHGTFRYDKAVYVHAFGFQQVVDLTFEDTVGHDLDVAFRDISLTLFPQLGGALSITSTIDLDDEPLP